LHGAHDALLCFDPKKHGQGKAAKKAQAKPPQERTVQEITRTLQSEFQGVPIPRGASAKMAEAERRGGKALRSGPVPAPGLVDFADDAAPGLDVAYMDVMELRFALVKLNLSAEGNRKELVDRLRAASEGAAHLVGSPPDAAPRGGGVRRRRGVTA